MSNDRPCEICGAVAGDVFALRREDDARILVCYTCFGRGIDEGTLVEQMTRPQAAPNAASPATAATAGPAPRPAGTGAQSLRIEQRDTGDLAIGFAIGFVFVWAGLLALRLFLPPARRRDKIYAAWFGWAFSVGITLLLVAAFGPPPGFP
jgi:hypothetical protein